MIIFFGSRQIISNCSRLRAWLQDLCGLSKQRGEMRYWTHIIIISLLDHKVKGVHIPGTASFLGLYVWLVPGTASFLGLGVDLSHLLIRYSGSSSALGQLRYLGSAP